MPGTYPRKIGCIVRQQPLDSMAVHRGNDVGIVNLLSPNASRLQQIERLSGDASVLVCYFEFGFELANG